jgi:hypothetical protein
MVSLAMAPSGSTLIRSDFGLFSSQPTNVANIPVTATQPPTVVQPGAPATPNLNGGDWRFSANTVLRGNLLYGVQAVDFMGRAAIQIQYVDLVTNNASSEIISDPTLAFTFPSIAVNEFGDFVIGVTGTSTTEFASSYALVRRSGSGVFEPPLLLRAGVDNFVRFDTNVPPRNRWGDYSATTVDPADPSVIWTNQEFVDGANRWATQVTELILSRPDEARWAEPMDGAFDDPTMWLGGSAPLPSDQLIFSRPADPGSGPITIVAPPPASRAYVFPTASFRQGNVRLDLGGNRLDLLLHLEVGPYYASPQATVANGVLTSVIGAVAPRPTSEGSLTLDNVQWNVADVAVGSASAGTPGYPGDFGGTGVLTIDNNSQLNVGNTLKIWQRGTVNLSDGVLNAATIDSNFGVRNFNFSGGTLHVDKFFGELENMGGTLAPGASLGTTEIALAYFQRAGGTLAIEIGGTSPADHDRLITGLAHLDGLLDVSLLGGFMPSVGDAFDILDFGGVIGSFATMTLPTLPGGRRWDLSKLYVTGELSVLPPYDADFDEDGDVDGNDLANWKAGFGASGAATTHMQGNADGDLDVDGVDFLTWQRQLGSVASVAVSAAAPEPTGVVMGLLAAPLFIRRHRFQ